MQEISTNGKRWRTNRGIRVGTRSVVVPAVYRTAVQRLIDGRPAWFLIPRIEPCIGSCDGTDAAVSNVVALTAGSRVSRFVVNAYAGGE